MEVTKGLNIYLVFLLTDTVNDRIDDYGCPVDDVGHNMEGGIIVALVNLLK